jgi:GR25 family glycosyltransferase involved in LPS biosynthesis
MLLNKIFDKIFLINLERRKDRLEEFLKISNKYNFQFELYKAFDGMALLNENFTYENKKISYVKNEFYKHEPGNFFGIDNYYDRYFKVCVGCLLSHLEILKLAKKNNYKSILILEDDVVFSDNLEQKLDNLSKNFPNEWDMFYLSGSLIKEGNKFDYYSELISAHTTHSYAVNSSVYDILIKLLETNMFKKPVDSCYVSIQGSLKSFIAMPFLSYQASGFSNIHNSEASYDSIKDHL